MTLPISYCLGIKIYIGNLTAKIEKDVENLIRAFSHQEKCKIIELNVQIDYVYLLVMIPPKIINIFLS